jgi:hypothetical protein
MASNRFEEAAQKGIAARRERQILMARTFEQRKPATSEPATQPDPARDKIKIREAARLNHERTKQQTGDAPLDLWGPEAAGLCDEFLEFVGKVSTSSGRPLGAILLQRSPLIGRSRFEIAGYDIAQTDLVPPHYSTQYIPHEPPLDTFLCTDGLVRVGKDPLPIVPDEGNPMVPKFGQWSIKNSTSKEINYSNSRGYITKSETITNHYSMEFAEANDPTEILESRLVQHAIWMQHLANSPRSRAHMVRDF